jgi:hypothetical protein
MVELLALPMYISLGRYEAERLRAAHEALADARRIMTAEAFSRAAAKFSSIGYVFVADECRARANAITAYRAARLQAALADYRQRVSAALDAGVDYCGEVEVRWTE